MNGSYEMVEHGIWTKKSIYTPTNKAVLAKTLGYTLILLKKKPTSFLMDGFMVISLNLLSMNLR